MADSATMDCAATNCAVTDCAVADCILTSCAKTDGTATSGAATDCCAAMQCPTNDSCVSDWSSQCLVYYLIKNGIGSVANWHTHLSLPI